MKPRITQEYLMQCVSYDHETGEFHWRERPKDHFPSIRACSTWNAQRAGRPAGHVDRTGGVLISINNATYRAHRLAWLYVHGEWPEGGVDHIDRVRTNNSIRNLRIANQSQNCANASLSRRNTSGAKGVAYDERFRKWRARITVSRTVIWLGHFPDLRSAKAAYDSAAREHFGAYATDGQPSPKGGAHG